MPEAPLPTEARVCAAGRELLRAVSAAVKLVGLYAPGHPVAAASLKDFSAALGVFFNASERPEASLALIEGRWVVDGQPIGEADLCEPLAASFRTHTINSLTIVRGALTYELQALCQLAALPPSKSQDLAVLDFLRQRGVRRLRVEAAAYRKARADAPPPVENPVAASAPKGPAAAGGFGPFIKQLVEESVSDPAERARIYAETVQTVKRAIDKRVGEATQRIDGEKRAAVRERQRTESVMSAVADGKVVVDKDGRVLMLDAAAEQILGKRLVEVAGKPLMDQVDGEHMAALSREIVVEPGAGPQGVDLAADPEILEAFRSSMAVVQDESGRVVGTYGMLPYVKKLQEAVKLQDEFVSNITHDLKAPLASILSALELINDLTGKRMSEREKRFLDISRRNCAKLRQMVDEILGFAKIQSGQMEVRPVPAPLAPIVSEAVEALQPWAQNKRLKLDAQIPGPLQVLADHPRLVHVLTNLVSNAIKYTPEGGSIRLAAVDGGASRPGQVVVAVSDTGCGIDPDDQKRLFEKFTQVGDARRSRDGVGLGLAIVKMLVEKHGGLVWLRSEWGKGSTFYFSLPAA